MELRTINTFLHIAELHSFSRAARELGYSQSAVSAQVAQLEAELETPLFDRVGKTVRLTDAGQTFLTYARSLLATAEQAKAALQPARQAALQAIMTVENARQRGARLSAAPHVRTFLRLLTGNSRMNTTVAQRIPGLNWDPKHRLSSLKQVEEALDALIASHGECCPLPLPVDVQAELFPEVQHSRTERRKQRSSLAFTRKMRREERAMVHHWRLRQNLLGQAVTELNFQSPETVISWYRRWAGEFDARELAPAFWHWRSRYASLASLDWLRDAGEPLYGVMHEISFIVRETPESVRQAERWQVPNKLTHRRHG